MIHTLSAYVQAHQRGMLSQQKRGTFGEKAPTEAGGAPKRAAEVAGPTNAVRKADQTADRNRNAPR